jgi:transposase-like protein
MKCPKCKSDKNIKDSIVKQKQRYKCKKGNFRYTVVSSSRAKPFYLRKLALQLSLEGLGFRFMGRVLNVSNVTVLNWIRSFGEQVAELKSSEQVIYAEIDEMHPFVGKKKAING